MKKAFTLIELLICVTVIALLAAIALSVLHRPTTSVPVLTGNGVYTFDTRGVTDTATTIKEFRDKHSSLRIISVTPDPQDSRKLIIVTEKVADTPLELEKK